MLQVISLMIFSSLVASASSIVVRHDPAQCPKGIEGHYKISATSDMNFYVMRNSDKNLVTYFKIDGASASEADTVDGIYKKAIGYTDDGTMYEAGRRVSFCQNSALYSKFESNGRSSIESNVSKMTVVSKGLQIQTVEPLSSDVKVWPRVN